MGQHTVTGRSSLSEFTSKGWLETAVLSSSTHGVVESVAICIAAALAAIKS